MSQRRIARIEELLREELSVIIRDEVNDPRIGFVTVSQVKVSADLGHAKVYVSVMGDAKAREATMKGITSAGGYIQRALGARVKLKFLPHLEFLLDDTLDQAFHIEEILKKIEDEKSNK
ncbi:MAG: 30S ribosome-binding factor RbfA [Candidatus Aureabacteria bacterium]|nr:30S ribosome-binding factor RbfA [Candidatus Auribacterota bacterium]